MVTRICLSIFMLFVLSGCFGGMTRPARIEATSEIYVVDSIPDSLSIPLGAVVLEESSVIVQKSLRDKKGQLVVAGLSGAIGFFIADSVYEKETRKEMEDLVGLKNLDLKGTVDTLLDDMKESGGIPPVLTPVKVLGNGLRYELHPYIYAVSDNNGVDVLVTINASLIESDGDERWSGKYVRHSFPLVPKATINDQNAMHNLLESGLKDAIEVFLSDIQGLVKKKDETRVIPTAEDSYTCKGEVWGWMLETPYPDLEVFQARATPKIVFGGIHIFSPETLTLKTMFVPEKPKYVD